MIFLLSGEDTFRIQRYSQQLKQNFLRTVPKAITVSFDGAETTLEDAVLFLAARGLFGEPRLAIFKARGGLTTDFKKFQALLAGIGRDKARILVIWSHTREASLPRLSGFVRTHFPKLKNHALLSWLREEGKTLGIAVERRVLLWLVDSLGDDTGLLSQELEKLASFKPEGTVTLSDLGRVSSPVPQSQFFAFLEAFLRKEKNRALSLFFQELGRGEDPLRLLATLSSTFRTLTLLHSTTSRAFPPALKGTNPYWIRNLRFASSKLSFEEIRGGFQDLAILDWQIKTGRRDAKAGLEEFIISWLTSARGVTSVGARHSV